MSVEADRPDTAGADAARAEGEAQLGAALAAGVGLIAALRKIAAAVAALLVAEAQVLRASIALVCLAGVALVAFAVSLWACVVALLGWGLAVATGSFGIALGILVALHLALVIAIWLWIKRTIRHASFPTARAELHALGHEFRRDLARFQSASPPQAAAPKPEDAP